MATRRSTRLVKRKVDGDFVQFENYKNKMKELTREIGDNEIDDNSVQSEPSSAGAADLEMEKNDGTFELVNKKADEVIGKELINLATGEKMSKDTKVAETKEIATQLDSDDMHNETENNEAVGGSDHSRRKRGCETTPSTFECELCSKNLSSRASLEKHQYRHTGIKPYTCETCGQSFIFKGKLSRHMRTHMGGRMFVCEVCGKGFSRNATLTTHLGSHTDEKKYACDQCDKVFKQKQSLTAHLNTHTPENMSVCHLCGKAFGSWGYLQQHLRSHSATSSYKCDLCNKTFQSKQSMEEHAHRHNGEKPVICKLCCKRFYNKKELSIHMRYHNNVTDFRCDLCHMYFKFRKTLDTHYSRMHGKQYSCRFCDKGFSSKRLLQTHLFREHRDLRPPRKDKLAKHETANFKKVPCMFCSQVMSNKYRLRKHIMKKHSKKESLLNSIHSKPGQGKSEDQMRNIGNGSPTSEAANPEIIITDEQIVLSSIEKELVDRKVHAYQKSVFFEELVRAGHKSENVDRPVVVIYEEEIAADNSVPTSENQQLSNVPTFLQNSIHSITTEPKDFERTAVNDLKNLAQNEEVVVIVNLEGENVELHNKYDNFMHYTVKDGMFDQVAEEVIIQHFVEDTAESNTFDNYVEPSGVTNTAETKLNSVTNTAETEFNSATNMAETELNGITNTAKTELSSSVKNTAETELSSSVMNTAETELSGVTNTAGTGLSSSVTNRAETELSGVTNTTETELSSSVTNTSEIKLSTVTNTVGTELSSSVTNTAETELSGVTNAAGTELCTVTNTAETELSSVTNTAEKELSSVTHTAEKELSGVTNTTETEPVNELEEDSGDLALTDNSLAAAKAKPPELQEAANTEQSRLDNILPQIGTLEEFSKFESELVRGMKKLRKFDQYGQFLNNVLEFVQSERRKGGHNYTSGVASSVDPE